MYKLSLVLALAAAAHARPLGLATPDADVPDTGKSPLNAAASYRSLYAIQINELEKAELELDKAKLDNFTDSQRTDLSNRIHAIREMVTEYKEKIIEASGEIVTGGGLVAKDEGKLDAFATHPHGPARRRLLNAQAKQRAYARKSKEKVTKRKNRRRRRAARAKKEEAAKKEKEEAEQKKKQLSADLQATT